MNIKIGRIAVAAIVADGAGILALIVAVAVFGPAEPAAAQTYAEHLGLWIGPASGMVFCFLGGIRVVRHLQTDQTTNGLLLGVTAAALDVGLSIAGSYPFTLAFALSNVGRIVAGGAGGWTGARIHRDEVERSARSER